MFPVAIEPDVNTQQFAEPAVNIRVVKSNIANGSLKLLLDIECRISSQLAPVPTVSNVNIKQQQKCRCTYRFKTGSKKGTLCDAFCRQPPYCGNHKRAALCVTQKDQHQIVQADRKLDDEEILWHEFAKEDETSAPQECQDNSETTDAVIRSSLITIEAPQGDSLDISHVIVPTATAEAPAAQEALDLGNGLVPTAEAPAAQEALDLGNRVVTTAEAPVDQEALGGLVPTAEAPAAQEVLDLGNGLVPTAEAPAAQEALDFGNRVVTTAEAPVDQEVLDLGNGLVPTENEMEINKTNETCAKELMECTSSIEETYVTTQEPKYQKYSVETERAHNNKRSTRFKPNENSTRKLRKKK